MAVICELAHEQTLAECRARKIKAEIIPKDDTLDVRYTAQAQKIFDRNYDLITGTLNL